MSSAKHFLLSKIGFPQGVGGEPPSKRLFEPVMACGGKSTGLLGSIVLSTVTVSGPKALATSSPFSMLPFWGGRLDFLTSCAFLFQIL